MTPVILKYVLFIISQGLFFSTVGRGNWAVYIFTGVLAIVSTAFLASKELYGAFLDVVGIEAPIDPSNCAVEQADWDLVKDENTCEAMRSYLERHGASSCLAVELAAARRAGGLCQAYDAEQVRIEAERQARIEAERQARIEAERQARRPVWRLRRLRWGSTR